MKRLENCLQQCGNSPLAPILKTAGKAALQAGRLLASLYSRPHEIRFKGEIDLVTEADPAAEKMILGILDDEHPEVEILAEESHSVYNNIPKKAVWIVDPLDGTTNFAHGFPWFAVSIAYMEKGKSLVGVIYAPMLDELFCACRGRGAWLNDRKIEVSGTGELTRSLLATGFPYDVRQRPEKVMAALEKVLIHSQGVRRAGAAALDLAYVACGRLEGFWEIKLKPWDTAAGILLVEEAGGRVTDFQGESYSPFIPEIVSSNGHVHAELVELLQEFGESS